MNAITTFKACAAVPALPAADLEIAKDFARASKAAATRHAYQKDFARFTAWCDQRHLPPIPAAPETVAAFLAAEAVLREKWPVAFPVKDQDVRPLAIGAASEIATAMGWLLPYTLGVLGRWKMASVYCQAVLCHDQRITLDGAPAEPVGAEAKDMAAKQLARLAARKAATKAAKAAAPAAVKPPTGPNLPIETPPKTPEQLRSRVRAALLRRSA